MKRLQDCTALVTGAAKRIGRAIALALAREGVHVVIHYHTSQKEADAVADEARQEGVRAWTLQADLSDPLQTEQLLDRAIKTAGPLDILVNSASIFPQNHITDFTVADFYDNMQINALAPLWLSRAFARQEREGEILNLLDTRIHDYDREHAAYHLSKHTLYALTRMLSVELAPCIRVNGVAPGLILPPPGKDRAYLEQRMHTNPLQKIGTLEDIVETVLFLLRSDFVTGQIVCVDGGQHMKGLMYGI
jgi:NAD(P)-dependent dehydrogenase (short-subunit alcohol dehydrogenase family)